MHKLFIAFLFLVLLLEGFGIQYGRELALFLIILVIPILFSHLILHGKKFNIPKKATIAFITFLLFSTISTIFSVDPSISIGHTLYTITLFMAFLIAYNLQRKIEHELVILILICSILFCIYSLLLNFHLINFFIPQTGYQFVFSRFVSHNHLGDFLVLSIILLIWNVYKRTSIKLSLFGISVFAPLVLLSYSRSAYLSLALTTATLHVTNLQKKTSTIGKFTLRLSVLAFLIASIFFSIAISREGIKQPLPKVVNSFLVQQDSLSKEKNIHGSRLLYFTQALLSIKGNPLFGVGPDNFLYASQKYAKNKEYDVTQSAHNLFLEIATTNGFVGALSFGVLLAIIFFYSRKNRLFYVLLGMVILFQTDYIYQIYSFLLLFFIIAGTIYSENPSINPKPSSS